MTPFILSVPVVAGLLAPQVVPQFQNTCRRTLSHKQQLPVSVLRHQDKAVVIVVKLRSVAVGQNLLHGLPASVKAP